MLEAGSEGRKVMPAVQTVTQAEIGPRVLQVEGPVALDFYQASCPPCRTLEPRLEQVAREYQGRLPVYRVDLDRDMPVAEGFRVMSIPTILIFEGGKEVERLDGLITESALRTAFGGAAKRSQQTEAKGA